MRLLFLLSEKKRQQLLLLPMLNQNEIRNRREEIHEVRNEQRFLFHKDDRMYIRTLQSLSSNDPAANYQNCLEVYNLAGQKKQKITMIKEYFDTVYSTRGRCIGYIGHEIGEPVEISMFWI